MDNETYRGVVHGGMVVFLDQKSPLSEGTEVLVTPMTDAAGTAAAVLAAVESSPRVPSESVDELEQLIAAGRRPPTHQTPFSEHGAPEPS
jgi:hypothetical protein